MFSFRCGTAHKSFLNMQHIIYQNPEKLHNHPWKVKQKECVHFVKMQPLPKATFHMEFFTW